MEKKFRVLHVIGTLWKVLAWIALIVGALSSLGVMLVGILGSDGFVWRYFGQDPGVMPGLVGLVSGIVAGIGGLIVTVIYFVILYAIGELVLLLLAIEENTRLTVSWMQYWAGSATPPPGARPAFSAAPSARQSSGQPPSAESDP